MAALAEPIELAWIELEWFSVCKKKIDARA
jgi:hypothetical protein